MCIIIDYILSLFSAKSYWENSMMLNNPASLELVSSHVIWAHREDVWPLLRTSAVPLSEQWGGASTRDEHTDTSLAWAACVCGRPVHTGTHTHSFGTIQNDSDFPRVPCVSYGQFISYKAWIQPDKMVKLYIPLGLREVKIGNIIKHVLGGWFSFFFFFWC